MIIYLGYMFLSVFIALLGRNRKFGFWGYLFCSMFLTPVLGAVILLASDPRKPPATSCPRCSCRLDAPVIGGRERS